MQTATRRLYQWAIHKAASEKATFWLGLLFALELVLFIPLDAVLAFFCLQQRQKTLLYVITASLASTISALAGYFLGHFLWDLISPYLIPHVISAASFDRLSHHLDHYENWAAFFGALLPFPLKVLSLAAGVFHLGAIPFALSVGIARLLRFSAIGAAITLFGEKLKTLLDRHFHRVFLLIGAKVALVSLFLWAFS